MHQGLFGGLVMVIAFNVHNSTKLQQAYLFKEATSVVAITAYTFSRNDF